MKNDNDRIEATIRLLANGRYIWTVTINDPTGEPKATAERLKQMDGELRDSFPNHVQRGSVRSAEID